MDKLKMHSPDLSQDNIAKIRDLFPGCVTEARDEGLQTIERLRREVTKLKAERDILKKAAAYFAKDQA